MTFDILSDSAIDIARGKIDEAWGGKSPEGGLDFPSACVLSKTEDFGSDLHLDLGITEDTEELSDMPWLADVTHSDVQGPHDSDSPFRYQSGEFEAPGMFGRALKSYGQIMALCNEYQTDTRGIDSWFRAEWGVSPDADLTEAIPVCRSHGDALWGGIKRKLAPSAYAQSAASKQLRVAWHGSTRKDIGEHRLVDWPRLTAVAQLAGTALMVEDRYAGKRLRRIDYKLVRKEFPVAPTHVGEDIARVPVLKNWEVRDLSRAALEHIAGFRKQALILARGGLGGALEVDDSVDIPSDALVRFLKQGVPPSIPYIDLMGAEDGIFDIDDVVRKPSLRLEGSDRMNVYNAFASVVRPYVDKHIADLPLAHNIRMLSFSVRDGSGTLENNAEARRIVHKCVPDDFLLRVYRLYCIVNKSKEKGSEVISSLMKTFDAPQAAFATHDWHAIGRRVKNSPKCLGWFTEEIARAVTRHVHEHGMEAGLIGSIRRILSQEGTGDIALAEIVRKRRNWWAKEYRRRAKNDEKRKVEYQVKSKLFRHTKLKVTAECLVQVDFLQPGLITALQSVARAYIRKRRGRDAVPIEAPDPGHRTPAQYVHFLDAELDPDKRFSDGWASYKRSIEYLLEDVEKVLEYIADAMPVGDTGPGGDLDSDLEEEEDAPESDDDGEKNEEPEVGDGDADSIGDVFGGESDEDSIMNDFEDEDDYDEETARYERSVAQVDLAAELAEDLPHLTKDEILAAVMVHGARVGATGYAEIRDEVHAKHFRDSTNRKKVAEREGEDITDTRA